jgi:hypothetical protein
MQNYYTVLHYVMYYIIYIILYYTGCNRIRYTTSKIYCDQTNSNITTQFLTEHLLTLQNFLQVFSIAATDYVTDIHMVF